MKLVIDLRHGSTFLEPDTQKHLSLTYLSAVHVTAVNEDYLLYRECVLKALT